MELSGKATLIKTLLNYNLYFQIMVKVNKDLCIGCGSCSSICPEIFELDDEGKAIVKAQKKLPCVEEAIEACPVDAISK